MKTLITFLILFLFTANTTYSQSYTPPKKETKEVGKNTTKIPESITSKKVNNSTISSDNRRNFYTGYLFQARFRMLICMKI